MGNEPKPKADPADNASSDPHALDWGEPDQSARPRPGSLRDKLRAEAAPPPLPSDEPATERDTDTSKAITARNGAEESLPTKDDSRTDNRDGKQKIVGGVLPPPLSTAPGTPDADAPSIPLSLSELPSPVALSKPATELAPATAALPLPPKPTSEAARAPLEATASVDRAGTPSAELSLSADMKRVAFAGGSSAASAAAAVLQQPLPEPDADTQSAQQVPKDPSRAKTPAQPGPATTLTAVDGQTAKKTDDQSPTRTASAIDDLLKARNERTSAGSAKRDSAGRSDPETPGDTGSDDDHTQADPAQPERRRARRRPAGLPREHIAANDDQPSIGGLLYALNRKPSNKPFFIATIASAAWLSVGLIFGYFLIAPDLAAATSLGAFVRESAIMTVLATIAGPIALAWFLAFLAWRSEELHLRSTAMTEVAVRLAEPDRMAEQQISSLGQAVRREVTFMNDAVSHALSRANELDSLVQSEVHALERSYEDNERKIRSLLQELASERNSLSGTGEHFKQTLATLAHDVPTLIERLSEQQGKLANIIAGAGENLTTLEHSLATRTGDLQSTLTDQTQALQIVFDSGSEAIGTALESRTDQVQAILTEQAQALGGTLDNHRTGVEETLSGYTNALGMVLTDQNRKLSDQLETQGAALTAALDDRALALTSEFETTTTAMATELDGRSVVLQGAIE
ncbi:MAG: hypothetical protein AAFY64_00655 [Pseudomonadota bacterium]